MKGLVKMEMNMTTIRYLVIEDASAGAVWTVDALEGYSDQFYAAPHGTVIATVTSAQEAERIATEQRRLYYQERRSAYPPRGPVCAGCGNVFENEQLSCRSAGTSVNGSYRLCEPCWTRCPYLGTWPGGGPRLP